MTTDDKDRRMTDGYDEYARPPQRRWNEPQDASRYEQIRDHATDGWRTQGDDLGAAPRDGVMIVDYEPRASLPPPGTYGLNRTQRCVCGIAILYGGRHLNCPGKPHLRLHVRRVSGQYQWCVQRDDMRTPWRFTVREVLEHAAGYFPYVVRSGNHW